MRLAFYDLDGTLVSSDVVDQYLWYAKRTSWWRVGRAVVRAPSWIFAERRSRLEFNELFFREYAGMSEEFLRAGAAMMAEQLLRPKMFPGAQAKLDADRAAGLKLILVTGSLDFAIDSFAKSLGFEEVLANRMEFRGGVAQGRLIPPVLAERAKVDAVLDACARLGADPTECKAYSDSTSDAPMLEAVGEPCAVNPSKGLLKIAEAKRWPVVSLK